MKILIVKSISTYNIDTYKLIYDDLLPSNIDRSYLYTNNSVQAQKALLEGNFDLVITGQVLADGYNKGEMLIEHINRTYIGMKSILHTVVKINKTFPSNVLYILNGLHSPTTDDIRATIKEFLSE